MALSSSQKRKAVDDPVPEETKPKKPRIQRIPRPQVGDCPICLDSYSYRNFQIVCPYGCDNGEACVSCHSRYLLDSSQLPHCMSCRREWSWVFVADTFPGSAVKKFRQHQHKLLVARDKAYLPQAQVVVEQRLAQRKIQEQINEAKAVLENLQQIYNGLDTAHRANRGAASSSAETQEKVTKCPLEECRGFLKRGNCGVCGKKVCLNCMHEKAETKDEKTGKSVPHECLPENKANVEYLKKHSKPCPKCGYRTSKVSGCFSPDTPVLLWDASTKLACDIQVGDQLIGDDGTMRTVKRLTTGTGEMYRIKQNHAEDYVVTWDHVLSLKIGHHKTKHWDNTIQGWKVRWFDHNSLRYRTRNCYGEHASADTDTLLQSIETPNILDITVKDYMKLPKSTQSSLYGYKTSGISWPTQHVEIDPYILGMWLGDGYKNGTGFASNDDPLISSWETYCASIGCEVVHMSKYYFTIRKGGMTNRTRGRIGTESDCKVCKRSPCNLCSIRPVPDVSVTVTYENKRNVWQSKLQFYDLLHNKHIPGAFLLNSRENRLQLLAGIIDTDGSIKNNGRRIVISQVREKLSRQILLLCRSLGFSATLRCVKRKNIKVPGREPRDYKDAWMLNISGQGIEDIPTRLPRKKCVAQVGGVDLLRTHIQIDDIGEGTFYGWGITGNQRFTLGDGTITKNCPQMFCIDCHTAWNWNTGRIERGIVHNPHFFEWQRRHGGRVERNPQDIVCGGLPNRLGWDYPQHLRDRFNPVLRVIHHIRENRVQERREWQRVRGGRGPPQEKDHTDIRIRYLEGSVDEKQWGRMLMARNRLYRKHETYFNIHQMFVLAATDIIQRLMAQRNQAKACYAELMELRAYYNRQLHKHCKRYVDHRGVYFEFVNKNWGTLTGAKAAEISEDLVEE